MTMMPVEQQHKNRLLYNGIKSALGELFKDKLMFDYIPYYEYYEIDTLKNNQFKREIYKMAKEFAIRKMLLNN